MNKNNARILIGGGAALHQKLVAEVMEHLLWAVSLWALVSSVSGQLCTQLAAADLGDTGATSDVGLLADSLAVMDPVTMLPVNPMVQVIAVSTVCLGGQGARDMYLSTSVVAHYLDGTTMLEATAQLELECAAGVWVLGVAPSVAPVTIAALTTTLRTDCITCAATGDPASHCVGKMGACLLYSELSNSDGKPGGGIDRGGLL